MNASAQRVPGPDNLVELFEESVKTCQNQRLFGTKNAKGDDYDWITYGEVAKRVDNLRGGLHTLGVSKEDKVAIIANNCVEWAISAYATLGLGGCFVPMYEAELERILKFIMTDSNTKVVFVSSPEIYEKVKNFPSEIESLEKIITIYGDGPDSMAELEKLGAKQPFTAIYPDPEEIADIIYTSGTTGNPKGVLLSHDNLTSNVNALMALDTDLMTPGDTTLSFLPWAHSFGQTAELHTLIRAGASTGFAENTTTIVSDLLLVKPTLLIAVPRIFNKVYSGITQKMNAQGGLAKFLFTMGLNARKVERESLKGDSFLNQVKIKIADKIVFSKIREKFGGNLRMSISSSAALSVEVAKFFDDIGIPIYEAWGMTELSPAHTANVPGGKKYGSVGRAIPGSSVTIDKSVTNHETEGEIIAYGPNVMKGYFNLPEATAEVMQSDGGLKTGDRGRLDAEGYLFITGRIKEQYKLENGKYVFPAGIEESIKLSPYIENVMLEGANKPFNIALVVPDFEVLNGWATENGLTTDPKQLVEESQVKALIKGELNTFCADFAKYETPKEFLLIHDPFTVENGILTQTLKLKRREVMKRYGEQIEKLYPKNA